MSVSIILPTAGSGERLGSRVPKPLVLINDKPLFIHTLESISQCALIDQCLLVIAKSCEEAMKQWLDEVDIPLSIEFVEGGDTRQESVLNGIGHVKEDCKVIVVHDGARPFIQAEILTQAIVNCQSVPAVVIGVPVKSTIKSVDPRSGHVESTLDRSRLWEIQTPQVFQKDCLIKAHQEAANNQFTDDASLVEALGVPVQVIKGHYSNLKITTKEDVFWAKSFLNQQSED